MIKKSQVHEFYFITSQIKMLYAIALPRVDW